MNGDILFFFGEHMDALLMYERLEEQIFARIPDVKIKEAAEFSADMRLRYG